MIMYAQIRQLSWSVLHRLDHFSIFFSIYHADSYYRISKNIINVQIITFLLWRWNGLMGLNMTKINQTPLHYLIMNASCTYFVFSTSYILKYLCTVKAKLLNIPYEKENCCIIVYVHKYFTTRETILLRSQHSWFGFLKNSLIGFPSIIQ